MTAARIRYVPKQHTRGKRKVWGVYDRDVGSYPYERPGVGRIAQDHPNEQDAQTEADRLEATR